MATPRPATTQHRVARGTVASLAPTATGDVRAHVDATGDGMWQPEPFHVRWGRRAITIPGVFLATALYLAALPILLLHAAISDAVHRRPLLLCRFHLTFWAIFLWHCIGVSTLAVWWVVGKGLRMPVDRWRHFHRALESWWGYKILGIASVTYRTRYVAEGLDQVTPGPVLVLSRHASTLDTVLPLRMLGRGPVGLILRIVKKRELLWDPCVDLMCHRLPRTLVRRGSGNPGEEIERLVRLTDGMDHDDAVVIFPEGTRFTPAKQAEILAKLAIKDPPAAARAARLKNLLPPRPAGTFALLDARPDMDVVFMAHTGLEDANRLDDLVGGSLLDATVKARFWRVPRAEVPDEPEARLAWLQSWWERVDGWVEDNRAR